MLIGLIRSMRPRQWAKNVFVLAPLVFAQRLTDPEALRNTFLAFVGFCCASSAVYLFNDIRDRVEDRQHPLKRQRPIAAGTVSVTVASVATLILVLSAFAFAIPFGVAYVGILIAYLLINLFYSLGLKELVILDVMAVSLGFVLRVLAGGLAIDVEVSAWLLLCTILLALFLAFSKRRHELILLADDASNHRPVLSHYSPLFLDQMINVVTASTVVSYAIYAISPETVERFQTRNLIFTIPLVLFGIFRYLYLIYQKPTDENPTEAILSDPPFLVNMVLWAAAVMWIVYNSA